MRGREGAGRHQLQGLLVFGLGLALTTGALALLGTSCPTRAGPSSWPCSSLANPAATVLRFVLFRAWVFRPRTAVASSTLITPENPA